MHQAGWGRAEIAVEPRRVRDVRLRHVASPRPRPADAAVRARLLHRRRRAAPDLLLRRSRLDQLRGAGGRVRRLARAAGSGLRRRRAGAHLHAHALRSRRLLARGAVQRRHAGLRDPAFPRRGERDQRRDRRAPGAAPHRRSSSCTRRRSTMQVPVAWNRSLRAYNRNPDVVRRGESERHLAMNRTMHVLGFHRDGRVQALISLFGVHATCIGNSLDEVRRRQQGLRRGPRRAGAARRRRGGSGGDLRAGHGRRHLAALSRSGRLGAAQADHAARRNMRTPSATGARRAIGR